MPKGAVEDTARAFDLEVSRDAAALLQQWLDELVRWNRTHDLTAARSGGELVDLMLADAMVLSRVTAKGAAVVDVGSGAGAPGLPLALLRPDLAMTLVEPLQKRVAFMRLVLASVHRLDVTVIGSRAEVLGDAGWDVAISRATLPPPEWLSLGARLVRPGGEVVALLAQDEPHEHEALERLDRVDYQWPNTAVPRKFVRYRRK